MAFWSGITSLLIREWEKLSEGNIYFTPELAPRVKEYCSHTTPCFKGKEQISAGNVPSFLDIFMLLTHTFIYWNIDSKLEFKSQNFFCF